MSSLHANGKSSIESPRHSADDALEDRDFQLLLEATYELKDYFALESRFIILVAGRLGLRAGEIVHMQESWIDWRRQMIEIPLHEPCEKGKDGGPCGYCRQLATQRLEHNEDMTETEALRLAWSPKTQAGSRSIPFDFHPRAEIVVERYFDRFDSFQTSKSGINRRLNKAVEYVDELDESELYPHCLRATAASYHASRGLDAISLQSLMGWADLSTAHRYVRRSGDRTRRALQAAHSK